jgi:hypothetical protein
MTQKENPYSPPQAEVADSAAPEKSKPSAGARFLWASGVCFVVFMVLILLVLPRQDWGYGALGSAFFALTSGLIALCIPVRNKAGFIIPAVVLSLVAAYLVGSNAEDETAPEIQAVEVE